MATIFDFKELGKLVIDYSDGIIQTSNNVNKELIQYAKDNKKRNTVAAR